MNKKKYEFISGKKRHIWIWVLIILALVVSAVVAIWYFFQKKEQSMPVDNRMSMNGGFTFSEDVISATGLTQVGMAAQEWKIDYLTEGLKIEETYLHVGEAVEANTPIFKVTQESYDTAKEELELALKEASLNLREGYITYETGKIDAQITYDLALVDAEYAKNTYDSAVLSAKESLEQAQDNVDSARQIVEEYTASIETNYYYTYYEVKEIQNEWYKYAEIVQNLYKQWNVEELEKKYTKSSSTSGSGGSAMTSGSAAVPGSSEQNSSGNKMQSGGTGGSVMATDGNANVSDEQSKYDVYCMYEEKCAEKKQEYEEAVELYETARDKALAGIAQAQSNLAIAEAKLIEQQNSYDNAVLSAKTIYDAALSEKENAQMIYESSMELLEEEFEALSDKQQEAQEHLDLLEVNVSDLYFCTEKAGTVMMNNVRAGDVLTQSTMILAYQDMETITVSASVEQDQIASLSIGDDAVIYVSGYHVMEGTVTAIDPVSDSQKSSLVTYSVTVTLTDAAEGLEGNMTASAYFGLTEEEKSMMETGMGGMK